MAIVNHCGAGEKPVLFRIGSCVNTVQMHAPSVRRIQFHSVFVLHALTTLNGQKSNAVILMPLFFVTCVIK